MRGGRTSEDYLADIREAATSAQEFVEGMTYEAFAKDKKTVFAVVRAFEILGEAATNIPREERAELPKLPWRQMIGMRNKLIHEYFGVDEKVVWTTIQEDLPIVLQALRESGIR